MSFVVMQSLGSIGKGIISSSQTQHLLHLLDLGVIGRRLHSVAPLEFSILEEILAAVLLEVA